MLSSKKKCSRKEIDKLAQKMFENLTMPNPSLTVLVKLGSLVIHVEEMLSDTGHDFDMAVIKSILNDKEVKAWIAEMNKEALLPLKRQKSVD